MELLEHLALRFREVFFDTMQEQCGLVQQPIERPDILDDYRFCETPKLGLLGLSELLSSVNDYWDIADLRFDPFHQIEAIHVRQTEVQNHAVVVFVVQFGQSIFGGANGNRFDVAVADQFHNALLSDLVVFYDQQALHAPPDKSVKPGESFAYSFGRDGLVFIAHGAHLEAALPFIVDGEDVHRNVPRVSSMLQAIQHAPAVHPGQFNIERDGARRVLACERQTGLPTKRYHDLEPTLTRHFHENLCEVEIVFDDQQRSIARLNRATVVINNVFDDERYVGFCGVRLGLRNESVRRFFPPGSIRCVGSGQVQRK